MQLRGRARRRAHPVSRSRDHGWDASVVGQPHVVVARDLRSGQIRLSGPYGCALDALCAAEAESQVDRDAHGGGSASFHVAALIPPIELGEPAPRPRRRPWWAGRGLLEVVSASTRVVSW